MAPKGKATKTPSKAPEAPKEYPTVAAQREAEYLASRPYQVLKDTKGISRMTIAEKTAYATYRFLDAGAWRYWNQTQQKEFWTAVEQQKIPIPLPKPKDLGTDFRGRDIGTYKPAEYKIYEQSLRDIQRLTRESEVFRERRDSLGKDWEGDERDVQVDEERNRRKLLGHLRRKAMGKYEGNPEWDDVVPIPQDDSDGSLAQIAYTDEYAEAVGYLRAIMAAKEYTPRVLELTEHIISMNAAHYTVWLYRASTILALNSPVEEELEWMNDVALNNQKNYQIWHHRQTIIDHIYPTISNSPSKIQALAGSELAFLMQMFDEDAKNYHVWSYRQYLVRKLNLFNAAEIQSIETLLRKDVRNNSAWSHRFFIVFSDPSYTTPNSKALDPDPEIPDWILDREIAFAKAATFEAPQNQSPWNYLRGVLRKGGRSLGTQIEFGEEFVQIRGEEEVVRSSHALDFLADAWAGEGETELADKALRLLGDRYDRIRKNYWEWRRESLKEL